MNLKVAIIFIITKYYYYIVTTEVRSYEMVKYKSEINEKKNKGKKLHFCERGWCVLCFLTTIFSLFLSLNHSLCLSSFLNFPFQHSFYDSHCKSELQCAIFDSVSIKINCFGFHLSLNLSKQFFS